jgi:hypothetical protein
MEDGLDEITETLWFASEKKYSCRVVLHGEPLPRIVNPYGIAKTSKKKIVLVCWQTLGLTKAGQGAGYRNLQLDRFIEVETLSEHFQKRDDFNPNDAQYQEWIYHI